MKLESIRTEEPVGPYSLDILAKVADEEILVAIENQLEETDLHHLGQLLTYATGSGAQVAIWVAHRSSAMSMRRPCTGSTKWTNERIRFFGVKIEVIKQG